MTVDAFGAWYGGGLCGDSQIDFQWFLCPDGRLRGAEAIDGEQFFDCGTWHIENDQVVIDYTWTADGNPTHTGSATHALRYNPQDDILTWGTNCEVRLERLTDEAVEEADCYQGDCAD